MEATTTVLFEKGTNKVINCSLIVDMNKINDDEYIALCKRVVSEDIEWKLIRMSKGDRNEKSYQEKSNYQSRET